MGFRCPNCREDFDLEKEAFQKHLRENPACGATALGFISMALAGKPVASDAEAKKLRGRDDEIDTVAKKAIQKKDC